MTLEYLFDRVEQASRSCTGFDRSEPAAVQCLTQLSPRLSLSSVRDALGGFPFSSEKLAAGRRFYSLRFESLKQNYLKAPPAVLDGSFDEFKIEGNWDGRYFSEWFEDFRLPLEMLNGFNRQVILLYGKDDPLVPVPSPGRCATAGKSLPLSKCVVEVLDGAGHALESLDGRLGPAAIELLTNAVNRSLGQQ
jgi:pimeloyl-ACP methyl ester carboxylesterase